MAETPDFTPSAAAIRNIASGFIDQAVALPACLKSLDEMMDSCTLGAQCDDAATVLDNSARAAISRAFLLGLLVGGTQPAHVTQLLQAHAKATPNVSALH